MRVLHGFKSEYFLIRKYSVLRSAAKVQICKFPILSILWKLNLSSVRNVLVKANLKSGDEFDNLSAKVVVQC